jgi:hypothetical protein
MAHAILFPEAKDKGGRGHKASGKPDGLGQGHWKNLVSQAPRRSMTAGQKAMAHAILFPDGDRGGRGKLSRNREGLEVTKKTWQNLISQARAILRWSRERAEEACLSALSTGASGGEPERFPAAKQPRETSLNVYWPRQSRAGVSPVNMLGWGRTEAALVRRARLLTNRREFEARYGYETESPDRRPRQAGVPSIRRSVPDNGRWGARRSGRRHQSRKPARADLPVAGQDHRRPQSLPGLPDRRSRTDHQAHRVPRRRG